ncbi:MAG: hypothetical protein DDT24_00301 [Chloroflexi bacterium]|nr:hypothetical protein [Chloroflexota bacterium]
MVSHPGDLGRSKPLEVEVHCLRLVGDPRADVSHTPSGGDENALFGIGNEPIQATPRLIVDLRSSRMLGPIEVASETLRMNCPLAPLGFALRMASTTENRF